MNFISWISSFRPQISSCISLCQLFPPEYCPWLSISDFPILAMLFTCQRRFIPLPEKWTLDSSDMGSFCCMIEEVEYEEWKETHDPGWPLVLLDMLQDARQPWTFSLLGSLSLLSGCGKSASWNEMQSLKEVWVLGLCWVLTVGGEERMKKKRLESWVWCEGRVRKSFQGLRIFLFMWK